MVRIQKEILSILDAPIGATYFMTEAERKEMAGGTSKEMVFPVPLDRTANAAVGFFSFSRQFATRQEARTYLADSIGSDLTRHFGKEPMLTPCGKAEYSYRYSKDGRGRELRFKLFSMTGGEKSAIMVYHGFPRTDGSMEREFAAIYADLVRK